MTSGYSIGQKSLEPISQSHASGHFHFLFLSAWKTFACGYFSKLPTALLSILLQVCLNFTFSGETILFTTAISSPCPWHTVSLLCFVSSVINASSYFYLFFYFIVNLSFPSSH